MFPTQTLLGQQSEADDKQAQLDEIELRNDELQGRVDELKDPTYIELLAREDFGLVKPGEESYVIVPPADQESLPDPEDDTGGDGAPSADADSQESPAPADQ